MSLDPECNKSYVDSLYMMSEILQNLYISDKHHVPFLQSDYDLIVNCTPDIPFPLIHNSIIRIPVYDHPLHAEKMYLAIQKTRVLESIHLHLQKGQTVLVHCHAGMQRSCAVVACYLVKYHGYTPERAINYIKGKRHVAFLNGVNFRETIEKIARGQGTFGRTTFGCSTWSNEVALPDTCASGAR